MALTAGELMDLYLGWVQQHRSVSNYKNRRRTHCNRFAAFRPPGGQFRIADLPADKVTGKDLEEWLHHLAADRKLNPQTRLHHETSVRAAWNWATRHPSPHTYLRPTFRPFAAVERTDVPLRPLTEDDLMTDGEVEAVFRAAEVDLDQFHRFGPKTPRPPGANPYRGFADLLRCYYHTGARTGELAACRVEDVLFRTGQVVLGRHKRSKKERAKTVRHITLNDEALATSAGTARTRRRQTASSSTATAGRGPRLCCPSGSTGLRKWSGC
jgi:integrase